MLKASLILTLVLITIVGHGQQTDSADYVIYSLIIKNTLYEKAKSVIIINKTSRSSYTNPLYGRDTFTKFFYNYWNICFHSPFDSADYTFFLQFDKTKSEAKKLTKQFSLPVKIYFIKESDYTRFFKGTSPQEGWEDFYESYPNSAGVYQFSDILYSSDKSKAIAYYAVHRNGLNGGGSILILYKINGQWTVKQEGTVWVN
jgi:hypothetical protein